ncbi:MAG: hypothetical protein GVY35_05090 [Bacteroidetes bacterium]|jgi:hypothetical protein|nr:hypothetical protein [Bacteroidota bacterium]
MPRALAAGLKKFAHIISPDVFGALSAEELVTKASDFEMRIFDNRADAEAWLKGSSRTPQNIYSPEACSLQAGFFI